MHAPERDYEKELERFAKKWTEAKMKSPDLVMPPGETVNGMIVHSFHDKVMSRSTTNANSKQFKIITNEKAGDIDWSRI